MNEPNLEFIKNTLDRMDFPPAVGEKLAAVIDVKEQPAEVKLNHEMVRGNETVSYDFKFRKSDTTDMYFFNSYSATLKTGIEAKDKTQDFRIRNGNNISADEAFNLVAGRAVQKSMVNGDGDRYMAWLKVDFSQKDAYGNHKIEQLNERYGYDLEKALDKFPIKEWEDKVAEVRADLVSSLKAGNLNQVTMVRDGKEALMFIEANPRLRTINIKDEKGVSVRRDQLEKKEERKNLGEKQGQQHGKKEGKRQGLSM